MKITKYGSVTVRMTDRGPVVDVDDFEYKGGTFAELIIKSEKWAYAELARVIEANQESVRTNYADVIERHSPLARLHGL